MRTRFGDTRTLVALGRSQRAKAALWQLSRDVVWVLG